LRRIARSSPPRPLPSPAGVVRGRSRAWPGRNGWWARCWRCAVSIGTAALALLATPLLAMLVFTAVFAAIAIARFEWNE